jgi:predicted metal-dependent hydrolase
VSTKRQRIDVSGIPVEVVRKDIKNLHLGVYPPAGRVRVAAPRRLDDEAVRLAVISRLPWIRRQQDRFEQQVRQSERELVTGESLYFEGRRYRLDVLEQDSTPSVRVTTATSMALRMRAGTSAEERRALLNRWYRERLREQLPGLVDKWQPRVGVTVAEVRIRRMKTRWGSCNASAQRIWLNSELAKKPAACLEYILVHEMIHLLERHHNERFRELMDRLMPTWRMRREELNRAPLTHEDWKY